MIMSKKWLNIFYVLLCFICVSCKKKNSAVQNSSSLHEEAVILESRISWAKELPVQNQEYISLENNIGDDPVLILLSQELSGTPLPSDLQYPALPNFPELDTTAFTAAQKSAVNDFCHALVKNTSLDKYIMSGYAYTVVLFRYNLKKENITFDDISNYVLGKPFINENECQCPVRLFLNDGTYIDVNLYIAKAGQNWKIHQIEYKNREKDE